MLYIDRRYEKAQKPVAAFEADIRRHRDMIDDILGESASEGIRFLQADCTPLKQVIQRFLHISEHHISGAARLHFLF